jgi:hypothetical protein
MTIDRKALVPSTRNTPEAPEARSVYTDPALRLAKVREAYEIMRRRAIEIAGWDDLAAALGLPFNETLFVCQRGYREFGIGELSHSALEPQFARARAYRL